MTYTFKCPACGQMENIKTTMDKIGRLDVRCARCNCAMDRQYDPPAIKFIGSGFYVNDYKKGGNTNEGEPEKNQK